MIEVMLFSKKLFWKNVTRIASYTLMMAQLQEDKIAIPLKFI